jgi:hypothetical protein
MSPIPIQLGVELLTRFFKESLLDLDLNYYPNSTWNSISQQLPPNSFIQSMLG